MSSRSAWCSPGGVGALALDPVLPDPAGSAWADALAAITAATQALATRFDIGPDVGSPEVGGAPVREVAVSVSGGRLLAPGWPALTGWSGSTRVAPDAR